MWQLLYRFFLRPAISIVFLVAALVSPKVRRGLAGRRVARARPVEELSAEPFRILVHAASVGEFEQAKPVIEALKASWPPSDGDLRVIATFFSPSGFEQQARYHEVDDVAYLPVDRPRDVATFLDRVRPDLILVVRYDLWPEFVHQAGLRRIPVVLICGVLHADSARFHPVVRGLFRSTYSRLALIHAVGEDDVAAFQHLAPGVPIECSGDTRYDRVVERARAAASGELPIERAKPGHWPVLVAGSTWPPDEDALLEASVGFEMRLVFVPHEPSAEHVERLRSRCPSAVLLSELQQGAAASDRTPIIVDCTGLLAGLYALADIAYVGGGYGAGVHSVLEPAAHGVPVICGPVLGRSRDAASLAAAGLLRIASGTDELRGSLQRLLVDIDLRRSLGHDTAHFVRDRAGATERIVASLRERGLLQKMRRTNAV